MSDATLNLTESLRNYLLQNSLREPKNLEALRAETKKMTGATMQISPEQGQFFALLLKLMGARKVLDIGTFTGYSALVCALALPSDGQVVTCDINKEATDVAQKYWREASVSEKIILKLCKASETLKTLIDQGEAGTFDFVFIDADKQSYPDYYELALKLVRAGGLIAVDNVLWSGRVTDDDDQSPNTKVIRAFNKTLHQDKRVMLSMLPVGDGLTLALKL